jgi:hypothetical protein
MQDRKYIFGLSSFALVIILGADILMVRRLVLNLERAIHV